MTFVFAGSHFLILEKLKPKKENEDIYKKKKNSVNLKMYLSYMLCFHTIHADYRINWMTINLITLQYSKYN